MTENSDSRPASHWIRAPRQQRSAKSMIRMLDAAESLLEDRSIEALSITDVVQTARTSVGAFYARFGDKEGLIHALDERYKEDALHTISTTFADPLWETRTLPETIQAIVELLLRAHQERRGLLRALVLHVRLHPDPAFQARGDAITEQLFGGVMKKLEPRLTPETISQVPFALVAVLHMVREAVLFPEGPTNALGSDHAAFVDSLARLFLSYLLYE